MNIYLDDPFEQKHCARILKYFTGYVTFGRNKKRNWYSIDQDFIGEWESRIWLKKGKYHRTDGPAIIFPKYKFKAFYLNGKLYKNSEDWFNDLSDEEVIGAIFNIAEI